MITSGNTPRRNPKVPKLWQSKAWLKRKYETDKLTEQEIATLAGTSQVTIHKWLIKHGLKKDR